MYSELKNEPKATFGNEPIQPTVQSASVTDSWKKLDEEYDKVKAILTPMSLDDEQRKNILASCKYLNIVDLVWLVRNVVILLNGKIYDSVRAIETQNILMYKLLRDVTDLATDYQNSIENEIRVAFGNGKVHDSLIESIRDSILSDDRTESGTNTTSSNFAKSVKGAK